MINNIAVSTDFFKKGYEVFPQLIPNELLEKLRDLFVFLMNPNDPRDKVVMENDEIKYVTNLENICSKGDLSCLALLGFSPILAIAEQICGDDFFMIQEFAVIKNLGDNLPVLWHQDMVNYRKGKCFTMGIYLDDADENDGALCVIPESHLSNLPICEIMDRDFIQIPVKAGDVLIHDMMLAHKSEPLQKNKLRRVIYFEFLSTAQVRLEAIYTEELIERRTKLIPAAILKYKEFFPNETSFDYKNSSNFSGNQSLEETVQEIYAEPIRARPSAYCFANFN
jgi:hypothetical protein